MIKARAVHMQSTIIVETPKKVGLTNYWLVLVFHLG